MKRLVFDIETEQFTLEFGCAKTRTDRVENAPKMRVACVFNEDRNEHSYYTPETVEMLIEELITADEVISFNGTGFDLLVLEKHYGLNGSVPRNGVHVDIHLLMTKEAGFRVSLDTAVQINFSERKHTDGRNMGTLAIDELKIACKSDVSQTYRLWQGHVNKSLEIPQSWKKSGFGFEEFGDVGPGHHMPKECPNCHDVGSMEFVEWDTDEMTEGQLSDYLAGLHGSVVCLTCNNEIDYGF